MTNDGRGHARVQPIRVLLCRRLSSGAQRLQQGKALEQGLPCARDLASTARDTARSYPNEVIDLCATEIIAMRSENVLSRVTRSCQESLPVWSTKSQSSSGIPLFWRVPTVIDGRIAAR